MASYAFGALAPEYASLWAGMVVDPAKRPTFDTVARRLYASILRYRAVEKATGVPASLIAVIHEREGSGRFSTHLHNGDPLTGRTYHVPAGRPPTGTPPFSWEESAMDALRYEKLNEITDWSIERALFVLETYNGFGYRNKGLRSPYLWAGTNRQQPGKYVADGKFDPNVMDTQLGCAGLLSALWTIDPSLRIGAARVPVGPPPAPPRGRIDIPAPAPITPTQGAIAGAIIAVVGGVAAGVAAFWQQIGDFFQHLFGG